MSERSNDSTAIWHELLLAYARINAQRADEKDYLLTGHAIHRELLRSIGKEPPEYLIIRTARINSPPSEPTVQTLPPELRQNILSYAIDDEQVLITPHLLAKAVTALALTSRTFHADARQVRNEWKRRGEAILEERRKQCKPPAGLINDLMGPIGKYKEYLQSTAAVRCPIQASNLARQDKRKRSAMKAAGVKEEDRSHIWFA